MKILAAVEIRPGAQVSQTWDIIEHEGVRHVLFSRTDDGQAVILPLDETQIMPLDPVFQLAVGQQYRSLLRLSDAKVVRLP